MHLLSLLYDPPRRYITRSLNHSYAITSSSISHDLLMPFLGKFRNIYNPTNRPHFFTNTCAKHYFLLQIVQLYSLTTEKEFLFNSHTPLYYLCIFIFHFKTVIKLVLLLNT